MSKDSADARRKWDRVYAKTSGQSPVACQVLREHSFLLPASGRALEVACGRGGNALLLAGQGLRTTALDISRNALDELGTQATQRGLSIELIEADTADFHVCSEPFDVIVVSNYLDRALCPQLVSRLSPGGLLFYQTFVKDKADLDKGPSNPDFLLDSGELLRLFGSLRILHYVDLGRVGDLSQGSRNQAMLVAVKDI